VEVTRAYLNLDVQVAGLRAGLAEFELTTAVRVLKSAGGVPR
jgi:hypothetical protein